MSGTAQRMHDNPWNNRDQEYLSQVIERVKVMPRLQAAVVLQHLAGPPSFWLRDEITCEPHPYLESIAKEFRTGDSNPQRLIQLVQDFGTAWRLRRQLYLSDDVAASKTDRDELQRIASVRLVRDRLLLNGNDLLALLLLTRSVFEQIAEESAKHVPATCLCTVPRLHVELNFNTVSFIVHSTFLRPAPLPSEATPTPEKVEA